MKTNADGDYVFECSGRIFEPNGGIWGLNHALQPFGGYDDSFNTLSGTWADELLSEDNTLTHAECVELGEFMAGQWRAFADKHRKNVTSRHPLQLGDAVTVGFASGPATGYVTAFSIETEQRGGKTHYTVTGDDFLLTASKRLLEPTK